MERTDLIEIMDILLQLPIQEAAEIEECARRKIAQRSEAVCNTAGGEEHAADECA